VHCLLIGNYGAGNLGDELLREAHLRNETNVQWTVCSASPKDGQLPRLPLGVRSFLTTPWWRTFTALRNVDAVVFGGGTLFTDGESIRACMLWWWHAFIAHVFGQPILLADQGIDIRLISTSEIKVSCLIPAGDLENAVRCLHQGFALDTIN